MTACPATDPRIQFSTLGDWDVTAPKNVAILGGGDPATKYRGHVPSIGEYLVSSSGQMSLPAAARHRWKLDGGGPVEVLDLGIAVLTLPKGEGARLFGDLLGRDEHAARVKALADDPDLGTT